MALMAGAVLGAGALGAGSSLMGSGKASSASKQAANLQMQQFQQTQNRLQPWVSQGAAVLPTLASLTPGTETVAQLEATPGYQFTLGQGLKAVQSANAAKGLGVSGQALKGAAAFATGLAQNTYQNIFNQQQQVFKNALDQATLGESAAAGVGQQGTSAAATAGSALQQAGLAQAAGTTGVGSSLTGAANNYLQYQLLQQMLGNQGLQGYEQGGVSKASTGETPWIQTNPGQ